MAKTKRRQHILTVTLADRPEPLVLEPINPDYLRVEKDGPRRGVPANPKDAPQTYMTAVGWAAAHRLKLYDGDLGAWLTRDCVDLQIETRKLDPTPPGPGTGSP